MRKIFKHTAVAVAALSAPFAMAEVTISGTVDQAVQRTTTHTNPSNAALGALSSSVNGNQSVNEVASTLSNYNYLALKGNEDLGNGLKATFEVSIKNVGPDNADAVMKNYLSHVGLEGSFGKIKIGQQWRPFFTAVASIDPTQLAAVPGFSGAGIKGTGLAGLAPEPNSNSITYNIPNVVPGLFVQLQKGLGEATTAATQGQGDNYGMYAIFTDGQKFFVAVAKHSEKMVAGGKFTASATGTNGLGTATVIPANALGAGKPALTMPELTGAGLNGLDHVLYLANGGETRDSIAYAATYNFGLAKLVWGTATEDVPSTQAKLVMNAWGVKIPVNEQIDLGYLSTKTNHTRGSITAVGSLPGSQFSLSGYKLLATYNLSKRTKLYWTKGYQKLDGGTAAGNEFSTARTGLGVNHNF
jgi:predicted porin